MIIKGAETHEHLDLSLVAGVDAVQGYLIARPMQTEASIALICQNLRDRSWIPDLDAARIRMVALGPKREETKSFAGEVRSSLQLIA